MPQKRGDRSSRIWRNRSTIILFVFFIIFFAAFMLIDAFTVLRALPEYDHSNEISFLKAQIKAQQDELSIFQMMLDDLASQNTKLHNIIAKNEYQPFLEDSIDELDARVDAEKDKYTRRVFFDLGANRGDSTRQFVGLEENSELGGVLSRQIFKIPARILGGWDIRIYEANPAFEFDLMQVQEIVQQLDESQHGGPYDVYLFTSTAIGTKIGTTEFFLDGNSKLKWGGSLLPDHPDVNGTSIKVPMHDLTREIISNYRIDDYVIVKMDIEGTEYELLIDLLLRGAFPYIDELYVEFHAFADTNNVKNCLSQILSFAQERMRIGMWQ